MYGTAPEAVRQIIFDTWQASRAGRPDVPPLVTDGSGNPTSDRTEADGPGEVLVVINREDPNLDYAVFDVIHCYHPDAEGLGTFTDQGFTEERVQEPVQVDIKLKDRTDPDTGERITARERMVGDRDDASFSGADPPYPGIAGEFKYVMETVRTGYEEFERVDLTPIGGTLQNSDATLRFEAVLDRVKNTVQ